MFKWLPILLMIIFLFPVASNAEDDLLIQVVIDDTGSLQDGEDPENTSTARNSAIGLLSHLSRTHGRGTRVIVISQHGGKNIWTGDSRKITSPAQNGPIEKFLTDDWGGCSDLLRVPTILNENIYLYPAKEHHFVFFSSLIHTGLPCGVEDFSLDNLVPAQFLGQVGSLIEENNAKYSFYWVFDDPVSDAKSKLVAFARRLGVRGTIRTETETRGGY